MLRLYRGLVSIPCRPSGGRWLRRRPIIPSPPPGPCRWAADRRAHPFFLFLPLADKTAAIIGPAAKRWRQAEVARRTFYSSFVFLPSRALRLPSFLPSSAVGLAGCRGAPQLTSPAALLPFQLATRRDGGRHGRRRPCTYSLRRSCPAPRAPRALGRWGGPVDHPSAGTVWRCV